MRPRLVGTYRRFWYHVLTCVSVRLRAAARSMRSCTLRYFCRSKLRSSWLSWWSVKAVRAFRGFFVRIGGLSLLLEISRSPSSLVPAHTRKTHTQTHTVPCIYSSRRAHKTAHIHTMNKGRCLHASSQTPASKVAQSAELWHVWRRAQRRQ